MIPSSSSPSNPSVGINEGVCACCRYWGGPRVLEAYQWRCIPSPDGSCEGPCMKLGVHATRSYYATCTEYVQCSSDSGCGMWNKSDEVDTHALRSEMEGQVRSEMEEKFRKSAEQGATPLGGVRDGEGWIGDVRPSDLPLSDFTMPMPCRGSTRVSSPSQVSGTMGSTAEPLTDPLFKKMVWGLVIVVFLAYCLSACRG